MGAGIGLRIFMIVIGIVIFGMTVTSLAKRHMTESFCIVWGVVALMIIIAGIVLQPAEWNRYISWSGLMLILFGVIALLAVSFYFSVRISRLTREIRELSIQISLLNQENAMILQELTGESLENANRTDEEKNLIRH